MELVSWNPLQLMFMVGFHFFAENAHVESRMHCQAVTVTGEVLQSVTNAPSQVNFAAQFLPNFSAHGFRCGF